jgi:hypothetical protein
MQPAAPAAQDVMVTSEFDGGNIELIGSVETIGGTHELELHIRPDPYCESDRRAHYQ